MNERIKQLAEQAGYKDFDYAIIAHRFAELIVQDCIAICRKTHDDLQAHGEKFEIDQMQRQIGINLCVRDIKQAFDLE